MAAHRYASAFTATSAIRHDQCTDFLSTPHPATPKAQWADWCAKENQGDWRQRSAGRLNTPHGVPQTRYASKAKVKALTTPTSPPVTDAACYPKLRVRKAIAFSTAPCWWALQSIRPWDFSTNCFEHGRCLHQGQAFASHVPHSRARQ